MGLPVGLLKGIIIVSQIDPLFLNNFVAMTHIRITQAADA